MKPQVIGITGSPIKNSNTDRVVKAVLANTSLGKEINKRLRQQQAM